MRLNQTIMDAKNRMALQLLLLAGKIVLTHFVFLFNNLLVFL